MNDPLYGPERSLAFYVAAERKQQAAASEWTLSAWAALALALVVLTIALGGCR